MNNYIIIGTWNVFSLKCDFVNDLMKTGRRKIARDKDVWKLIVKEDKVLQAP
jgi:hypothetical protein